MRDNFSVIYGKEEHVCMQDESFIDIISNVLSENKGKEVHMMRRARDIWAHLGRSVDM